MNYFYVDKQKDVGLRIAQYQKMLNDNDCKFEGKPKFLYDYERDELGKNDIFEKAKKALEEMTAEGLQTNDIALVFNNNYMKKTFSSKELYNLKKLEEIFCPIGVNVGVFDYHDVYNYNQVKKASDIIRKNANAIQKCGYSPLEKLLHAYMLVSNRKYKRAKLDESLAQSRSVYGILNSDRIVCEGFAQYLRAIVRELEDKNLKVFNNHVAVVDNDNDGTWLDGFHANNIVYVKDDKYKIDGFYFLDPTWDCLNKRKLQRLKFFLIEISKIPSDMIDNAVAIFLPKKEEKDDCKKANDKKPQDTAKKNFVNIDLISYSSVTNNTANLVEDVYAFENLGELSENLLESYLLSRRDFKDFLVLESSKKIRLRKDKTDEKKKAIFNRLFNKYYNTSEKEPIKLLCKADIESVSSYLKEHSPHVNIGPINDALHAVFKNMYRKKTKDEISKEVYKTLKYNINAAKKYYSKEAKTALNECEKLK